MKSQRGSRDTALLFLKLGARGGWVVNETPLPTYPRRRAQGRSGRVWKIPRPPGMDPPTLQPVLNRCPGQLLLYCHGSQRGTHTAMPTGTDVCSSPCMYQQKYDNSD